MRWASPGKDRWDMAASEELRNNQKLPLEDDADTEVDLTSAHVHAYEPGAEADLSVAVMQALKTLTEGYERRGSAPSSGTRVRSRP